MIISFNFFMGKARTVLEAGLVLNTHGSFLVKWTCELGELKTKNLLFSQLIISFNFMGKA